MLAAISTLALLGFGLGYLLGVAAKFFKVETNPIVEEIEAMLPGSQCGQCGFPGCTPAAEAVADGKAPVTMCPPGGRALAQQLADKLGIDVDLSQMEEQEEMYAFVSEATCIGCTRCYKACPTSAIVGAPKQIHSVIPEACTGCKKCVDVCPTECLQMRTVEDTIYTWHWPMPQEERQPQAA